MASRAADLLPLPTAGSVARGLAQVAVVHETAQILAEWEALEALAPCSAFQTRAWLLPWISTLGASIRPAFVVARDGDGTVVALLPLGLTQRWGLRVAGFLGGRDAGIALGLFHPDLALDRRVLRDLLLEAARQVGIDLFVLKNQPYRWGDRDNPLTLLPHQPSPSASHFTPLSAPAERFFSAKLSKKTRKRLRWKESKLATLGVLQHREAKTADEANAIIDTYLIQKRARFRQLGLRDAQNENRLRQFLTLANTPTLDGSRAVELHALLCDDRMIATFGGARHQGRFSGMIVSMDPDESVARYGPGEVLIAKVLGSKCDEGLAVFDLCIGEARYKDAFCPDVEPLFDTLFASSAAGRAAGATLALALSGKRTAKQTPWIWDGLGRLRRMLAKASAPLRKPDGPRS